MRLLVAGDPRSIHTARFIALLTELRHDVHLFSTELDYRPDEQLRDVTIHVPLACWPINAALRVEGAQHWTASLCRTRVVQRVVAKALYSHGAPGKVWRERSFARLAESLAPQLILSLKLQNEGYTVARARPLASRWAPWVHFSWGTDIEFFGKDPAHASRHLPLIREAYAACDFHIADTRRDLEAAVALGFRGRSLGAMPASGGFDIEWLQGLRARAPARRDAILVKGRHGGYVGKALHVLEAIRRRPAVYRSYRIRVFMATPEVAAAARRLQQEQGLDCEALPRLAYDELMAWYGRSLIAVSATDVDGTPAQLLEAMAMGAFPVHSDMASLREWIEHGRNGLLFAVDDIDALGARMEQALGDAGLRERGAAHNWSLIRERADRVRLRARLQEWIDSAAAAR